jgi:hypothetical protein
MKNKAVVDLLEMSELVGSKKPIRGIHRTPGDSIVF